MGLPSGQKGVLVEQVYNGSPADKAGIRGSYKPVTVEERQILVGGDIIIAVKDKQVSSVGDLQLALQEFKPGQKMLLSMLRNGEHVETWVTLGERPESKP